MTPTGITPPDGMELVRRIALRACDWVVFDTLEDYRDLHEAVNQWQQAWPQIKVELLG